MIRLYRIRNNPVGSDQVRNKQVRSDRANNDSKPFNTEDEKIQCCTFDMWMTHSVSSKMMFHLKISTKN